MGIFQARRLEWFARPSSTGSFQPMDQNQVSHIASGSLLSEAPGNPWAGHYSLDLATEGSSVTLARAVLGSQEDQLQPMQCKKWREDSPSVATHPRGLAVSNITCMVAWGSHNNPWGKRFEDEETEAPRSQVTSQYLSSSKEWSKGFNPV